MQKELEIAQVNELKFYLAWDYVKDICNEAIREENKELEKQRNQFIRDIKDLAHIQEENQQLKELLKKCRTMLGQFEIKNPEPRTYDVVEMLLKIDNAIGEKA